MRHELLAEVVYRSDVFQSLELDAIGAHLRQIVVRLLREPALGAAAKNLRDAHRHFGRNAAPAFDQFRQRDARHARCSGCIRDAQAQRLNAVEDYEAAGVRGIFHRHD